MRTTITLPDPVFSNASDAAKARGITLSEYITEALVTELNRPQPQPSEFRLKTFRGRVVPGVNIDKVSEFIDMEDIDHLRKLGR